jgi:hypothetical protein
MAYQFQYFYKIARLEKTYIDTYLHMHMYIYIYTGTVTQYKYHRQQDNFAIAAVFSTDL